MSTEAKPETAHGGRLLARKLADWGVSKVFTLSGGHLFSIYDGCRSEGIALVDVRHEQTAAFAAEGHAKATRTPGVCALTAGPGVTNAISAIAQAYANGSPMVVLGGRAPDMRWGQGSLQEIDHIPLVASVTKSAETAHAPSEISELVDAAFKTALEAPTGPVFVDFPLDVVFSEAELGTVWAGKPKPQPTASDDRIEAACELLSSASRPVVMAGTDLYWSRAEAALVGLCERLDLPVYSNGMARGCINADHPLAFSRSRSKALSECDLAILVGLPMDFRLSFGQAISQDASVVSICPTPTQRAQTRPIACELYGDVATALDRLGESVSTLAHPDWIAALQEMESAERARQQEESNDSRRPLHPLRICAEVADLAARDAVIVGDGGDFVSFAGRVIDSYEPGRWMDPGPYGCLGSGPGYAIAAKLCHPNRPVVLLLGDGAFGFSGLEFDTMVRHNLPVVAVVANNGIWGLEKHPMEFVYGYSVAADLQRDLRYDKVVEALGGYGELVTEPNRLREALERALASQKPALVNVLCDPSVAYPRKSNLA
jgi:acetolactate synthase I/II/III large subunit